MKKRLLFIISVMAVIFTFTGCKSEDSDSAKKDEEWITVDSETDKEIADYIDNYDTSAN